MRTFLKSILALTFVLLFVGTGFAQEMPAPWCVELESVAGKILKPTKTHWTTKSDEMCDLTNHFKSRSKIRIMIDKHSSSEIASSYLQKSYDILLIAVDDDRPGILYQTPDSSGFWDEAILYKDRVPDHFMLLRHKQFTIIVLSNDFRLFRKAAKELRELDFE